jgi:hypothetical protein
VWERLRLRREVRVVSEPRMCVCGNAGTQMLSLDLSGQRLVSAVVCGAPCVVPTIAAFTPFVGARLARDGAAKALRGLAALVVGGRA